MLPPAFQSSLTLFAKDAQTLHQKYTVAERLRLSRSIHHYLFDAAQSLSSLRAAEASASELANAIVTRAREQRVALSTIGANIKAPYFGSLERYLEISERDRGNGLRGIREVKLEWGGVLEKGMFLDEERVELAYLKSLSHFVRWAAAHSSPF
jgi:hypothetical protein